MAKRAAKPGVLHCRAPGWRGLANWPAAKQLTAWQPNWSRLVFLCVAWGLMAALPSVGWAQSQFADRFVTRAAAGRPALTVDVRLNLPSRAGLGVFDVTISSSSPSPADRDFQLATYLAPAHRQERFAYRVPVRLAEGQRQVRVQVPHLQAMDNGMWEVGLFEGGRDIEDRRGYSRNMSSYNHLYRETAPLTVAAICGSGESTNDTRTVLENLLKSLPAMANLNWNNPANQGNTANYICQAVRIAEAGSDWRRYLLFTSWTISIDALREMHTSHPAEARALRTYLASGGTLLVHGVHSADLRQEAGRLLWGTSGSESPRTEPPWTAIEVENAPWWQRQSDGQIRVESIVVGRGYAPYVYGGAPPGTSPPGTVASPPGTVASTPGGDAPTEADKSSPRGQATWTGIGQDAAVLADTWLQATLGGHVAVGEDLSKLLGLQDTSGDYRGPLRNEWISPNSQLLWSGSYLFGNVMLAAEPLDRLPTAVWTQAPFSSQSQSALISASADGNWFWKNLIQAVGKPPVWMFCAMVALFGGLIGPGLLVMTARLQRRSLMIFLVPACALVATLAIVVYSIVHEGFATHIRVTSVQWIHPQAEQGFVWSRQNYFSGRPPRDGLHFPLDVYARPVSGLEDDSYYYSDPRNATCEVRLTEEQVWRGWLKPRQHQQLLVGHPLRELASPITVSRDAGGGPRVTNHSQSNIPLLVLRGQGDDYYLLEQLAAGQERTVAAMDHNTLAGRLVQQMSAFRPTPPSDLSDGGSLLNFGGRRRGNRVTANYDAADILNESFRRYMSDQIELSPFQYALLMTESRAIELPLPGKESNSLHLIIGVQAW